MHLPGHDFYATVAQVIPVLLVTAAIEGRRLTREGEEEPLTLGVMFFAVLGEVAALAGLTGGGGKLTAEIAACGLALLASALIGALALKLQPAKGEGLWRRIAYHPAGFVVTVTPLVAGVAYTVKLYTS